ncbi:hypothetical protein VP01_13860g1, partial [Puccinia sorghi]
GAKLPATYLQEIKTKTNTKEGLISSHFNQAENFDNKTLKIISLWLLPFHYFEPGLDLFKRKWAATSGCVIYFDLEEAMLNFLKV